MLGRNRSRNSMRDEEINFLRVVAPQDWVASANVALPAGVAKNNPAVLFEHRLAPRQTPSAPPTATVTRPRPSQKTNPKTNPKNGSTD